MIFSPKIDNDKNVSWAANQHIRMISEGSCDTEACSNDDLTDCKRLNDSALLLRHIKCHGKLYISHANFTLQQSITILCIFKLMKS